MSFAGSIPRCSRRAGMMVDADVMDGTALDGTARRLLDRDGIAYLHVHNARPGCFAARVDRT